jgi:hypothetical protein
MAKFTIESTDPKINIKAIEARSWSGALSKVLGRFKGNERPVNLRLGADGQAEVWGEDDDAHLTLELDPDTGFEVLDDPTTELWDAPMPGSGARQTQAAAAPDATRAQEGIAAILDASTEIAACDTALNLLMKLIPAESGSILLAEATELRFVTVRGPKAEILTGKTIPIGHGIAGAVIQSGTALLVRSAREHAQHDNSVDAEVNHFTRTLLALAIKNDAGVIGVVELLNPFGSDTFTLDQQQLSTKVVRALAERL